MGGLFFVTVPFNGCPHPAYKVSLLLFIGCNECLQGYFIFHLFFKPSVFNMSPGSEIDFLGRCQLATEIFFSVARWKHRLARCARVIFGGSE